MDNDELLGCVDRVQGGIEGLHIRVAYWRKQKNLRQQSSNDRGTK